MVILTATGETILIDAVIKVDYSADVDVTKLAVETGAPISDHARKEPEEVELEGLNSDAEADGMAANAYLLLNDLRGQLVTLVAPLETYENMTLVGLKVPQGPDTGAALEWQARFRRVRQVTLQQTTVATKKKKSKGPTATTPTEAAPKSDLPETYRYGN